MSPTLDNLKMTLERLYDFIELQTGEVIAGYFLVEVVVDSIELVDETYRISGTFEIADEVYKLRYKVEFSIDTSDDSIVLTYGMNASPMVAPSIEAGGVSVVFYGAETVSFVYELQWEDDDTVFNGMAALMKQVEQVAI